MKKTFSSLLLALVACLGLVAAGPSAFASHLRGTSVSWSPTGVAGQVQFTIQYSQRTSFGGCNTATCAVGSTIGVPFNYGDSSSGVTVTLTVTSTNAAQDYLSATGTFTHTYTSAGPFIAYFENNARISTIISGENQNLRMETEVSPFASPANHSPVVSEPAIITVPLQATTGFHISASDADRDTLSYRMSTAAEMYATSAFACTYQQPPGLSVNANTGQVTWDTTQIVKAGCGFAAPKSGDLWTVQFMVHDLTSTGTIKSKVPLDIILQFVSSSEAPPTLTLSNPGPITVQAGTPISFTATGGDAAAGAVVTLNATGLPIGATASDLNVGLAPPVVSTFNWTPTAAQKGSYVITYSATNDTFEQVLASVTIYVQDIEPPVLTCAAPLTAYYGEPITIPLSYTDPQGDAVAVTWSVDGANVRTDNIAAGNGTQTDSISETFTTLGAHSVGVSATDSDKMTASCSTAITVDPAPQTISFTGPAGATFGSPDIALTGTASSGLPVSYTASGACSIVNGALHYTGAGTCTVTATQAGNADYAAATPVVDTFSVSQAAQAISFTAASPVTYGTAPIALAATGGASGNPVTYTVTGPATLSGNTLTVTGAGNVVVTANQAGNANYTAAPAVSQTIVVNQAAQAITFNPAATVAYGSAPITLAATGGASGNAITYTVTGPATLAGNVLTLTGAGNVVVTANQAGNANYAAATPVVKTIVVSQTAQAISFTAPATATYGSGPITLAATGGASGNPVTYTVTGPATLVGNVLTITGTGNVVVTANQAGNANYAAAPAVSQTIVVGTAAQAITFNPPASVTVGSAPITLAATGGASGNPVTYTVTGPATLAGNVLTVTGPGNVVVTANQAGNANYAAATPVVKTIAVYQPAQTITFDPPATATYGQGPITLSATGGASGNPVTYTVTGPATLSGNVLTITGAGNVVVTANQAGNASYNAATPVVRTIVVGKASQAISFTAPATASADTNIVLNGTGGASGNPITYTVTGPATVSGNILTITGAGRVVVTANQAGNANYTAATAVSQTITSTVTANVTLQAASTSFSYPNSTNLTACVTLTNGKTAGGTVSFYDGATLLSTQKVNGDGCYNWYIAPALNAGTHNLTAEYNDANNVNVFSNTVIVKVAQGQTTAEVDCSGNHFDYGQNFSCDANPDSGPNSGYMTYTYDGGPAISVPLNGASHALFTIPMPAVGTHTVVIIYPAQGNYGAFQLPVQTFTVAPAGVNLSLVPSSFYLKVGTALTLNATLTSWDTTAPSSAGTVSFYDGATLLGTAPVNASGVASLTGLKLPLGYHNVTAAYSGTSIYATATQTIQVQIGQN